jgi:molecular chaperone DnaJ
MRRDQALTILGLTEDYTEEQLKGNYRNLAKKYHPDLNKGNKEAEEQFKQVALAYEVLTKTTGQAGSAGFGHFSDFFGGEGPLFDSFIKNMFRTGFGTSTHQEYKRKDIPGKSSIKLKDLDLGKFNMSIKQILLREPVKISIQVYKVCNTCHSDEKLWAPCSVCGQTGVREVNAHAGPGMVFTQRSECSKCKGIGWVRNKECTECKNKLMYIKQKEIEIVVPEQYIIGQPIKLVNQGNENWKTEDSHVFVTPNINISHTSNLTTKDREVLKTLLEKI